MILIPSYGMQSGGNEGTIHPPLTHPISAFFKRQCSWTKSIGKSELFYNPPLVREQFSSLSMVLFLNEEATQSFIRFMQQPWGIWRWEMAILAGNDLNFR